MNVTLLIAFLLSIINAQMTRTFGVMTNNRASQRIKQQIEAARRHRIFMTSLLQCAAGFLPMGSPFCRQMAPLINRAT